MPKKISLFQNDRNWNSIKDEVLSFVDTYHSKGQAQNSDLNRQLESRLAQKFDRKHCITTGCCTDALQIAIELLNLPPNSRVGIPNYTFTATAHAVSRAGHSVVPIDVDQNYCLDPSQIGDVRAVVNVDLFGNMSDWKKLNDLSIPVINDSAQSFDSKNGQGWSVRSGMISCVSFSPSKPLSSWGSGGALFTDDDDLADLARKLRLHGKTSNNSSSVGPGLNSMMSTMEVAAVWVGLDHNEKWFTRRNDISNYLIRESRHPTANDLGLERNTFSKLVFQTHNRESVLDTMKSHNIDCVIHYDKLINDEMIYHQKLDLPLSELYKQISFTVPNQHTLTDDEVELIAKAIR